MDYSFCIHTVLFVFQQDTVGWCISFIPLNSWKICQQGWAKRRLYFYRIWSHPIFEFQYFMHHVNSPLVVNSINTINFTLHYWPERFSFRPSWYHCALSHLLTPKRFQSLEINQNQEILLFQQTPWHQWNQSSGGVCVLYECLKKDGEQCLFIIVWIVFLHALVSPIGLDS